MSAETVMAFDYGRRNIGIAVGQSVSRTAEPLTAVHNRRGHPDWQRIAALIDEWQPERFVVGMPFSDDGTRTDFHEEIETFSAELVDRFSRPANFCDERLSSFEAESRETSARVATDALAAQLILESWFAEEAGR